MRAHRPLVRLAAAFGLVAALAARAALNDKIEVDEGDVQRLGEAGLKVHVNTTPAGGGAAEFEGEIPPVHGWRITPELTYGLARDLEIGASLPLVHGPIGGNRSAGARAAVKWSPLHPAEGEHGATAAVQLEYGWISGRFQQATRVLDLVPIFAWRDARWLVAVNSQLELAFAGPDRGSAPRLNPALKVSRRVGEGISLGTEYYGALGKLGHFAPRDEQSHTLYLALDVDREPWALNFGVGRGLNAATDRWTVKAIVELPF